MSRVLQHGFTSNNPPSVFIRLLAIASMITAAAGCSDPVSVTPTDAGTDVPVAPTDAPVADAPTDQPPPADAPSADAPISPLNCGGVEVLDLNALGTTTDGVLRYTGMSPMMQAAAMVPMCTAMFNVPRILRYTAPAAGRVAFSTDNMGTTFDTTLAVLTGCPGPTATSLGCVDDNGVTTRLSSIVRTERALTAGESVYVLVGAFATGGTFALSVTAVSEVAVGAACDTDRVCVTGATCITPAGSTARCVANGTSGGACRPASAGGTRCDAPLSCSAAERCIPTIAAGAECDAAGAANVCVAGTSCQTAGTARTCVADGALNGRCRATDSSCDAGLGCARASNLCLPVVAIGAACDLASSTSVCITGSSCQGSPGLYRCVADGVLGGQCRASMGCDTGLGCNATNYCVTGIAAGATCDPSSSSSVCVSGSICVGSPGMYRCQPDGAVGGRCRAAVPRCDTGLGCGADRCLPTVAAGAACDPARMANVCADTTSCIAATSGAATCVADGIAGGRCRTTAMPCDTGLGCGAGQRCITAVAIGATCDATGVTNACVSPARCVVMGTSKARTCQLPSYVESEIASPTFVDACTADATRVTFTSMDDAISAMVPIGFTLRAYGADYTAMLVSTNGMVVLGDAALPMPPPFSTGGDLFPWVGAPRPVFAPFWDDLVLRTAGSVCVRTLGAAPSRTTVVEWFDASLYLGETAHLTFELVLREGSNQVDFLYQTLTPGMAPAARLEGGSAGIGVQGAMGLDATRHAAAVSTARGIRFAPR